VMFTIEAIIALRVIKIRPHFISENTIKKLS
jgi:hypothetical protein